MSKQIKISIDIKNKGLPIYIAEILSEHFYLIEMCRERGFLSEQGYQSYFKKACAAQETFNEYHS